MPEPGLAARPLLSGHRRPVGWPAGRRVGSRRGQGFAAIGPGVRLVPGSAERSRVLGPGGEDPRAVRPDGGATRRSLGASPGIRRHRTCRTRAGPLRGGARRCGRALVAQGDWFRDLKRGRPLRKRPNCTPCSSLSRHPRQHERRSSRRCSGMVHQCSEHGCCSAITPRLSRSPRTTSVFPCSRAAATPTSRRWPSRERANWHLSATTRTCAAPNSFKAG